MKPVHPTLLEISEMDMNAVLLQSVWNVGQRLVARLEMMLTFTHLKAGVKFLEKKI